MDDLGDSFCGYRSRQRQDWAVCLLKIKFVKNKFTIIEKKWYQNQLNYKAPKKSHDTFELVG